MDISTDIAANNRKTLQSNSPLEGQVQVDEEDTEPISNFVRSAGVLSGHGRQTGCGDNDARKADNVHGAPRVNSIMKPGTTRIVNQTWVELAQEIDHRQVQSLPAVVSQTALRSKGMPPFMPRLVYRITA